MLTRQNCLIKVFVLFSIFLIASAIFLFLPKGVWANDVVINEVFPNPSGSTSEPNEFIELYNKSSSPVTITNWTISDTSGSIKTYTIPINTLNPGEFIAFRREVTGIALNNTGDGVELKNETGTPMDSMSFGDTSTFEDKSWSRIPDGTGGFVENTNPTEGTANSEPPPTPTPTSAPTSTPAPTNTPTPGPTNTPTPTPKPPTPTPTKKPTPALTPTPTSTLTPAGEILGEETMPTSEEGLSPTPSPEVLAQSANPRNFLPKILIGAGVLLLLVSGAFLLVPKIKEYNLKRHEQNPEIE